VYFYLKNILRNLLYYFNLNIF